MLLEPSATFIHMLSAYRFCFTFVLCLAFALPCTATVKVFTMPNSAMEPTIREGEKFTAEMEDFQPNRGDLIIFEHEAILQVKRVIGVSGDVVQGRDLQVFINGKALQELYVQHTGRRPLGSKSLETFGPVTVPPGKLFVVGDNRDYSLDSRDARFGLVPIRELRGKPLKIVGSTVPERIGTTPK